MSSLGHNELITNDIKNLRPDFDTAYALQGTISIGL